MRSDAPHEPEPDAEVIAAALREVGREAVASELRFLPLERASNRTELSSRRSFRVETDQAVLCVLQVGTDLRDLHERSAAFSAACPTISCGPLFWKISGFRHYLATEYFAGAPLEDLVAQGRMSAAGALEVGEKIVTVLNKTIQPSTQSALRAELEHLLRSISSSPLFSDLDRSVLAKIIYPFIRTGAAGTEPQVRWTNGDFVARNVLVNASGDFRLIDYEFAGATHFFAEDAWRWHRYSRLPKAARKLPLLYPALESAPWLEALAIMRQMTLARQINGVQAVIADLDRDIKRLTELLGERKFGLAARFFLNSVVLLQNVSASKPAILTAQLFWSNNGAFSESNSQTIEYPAGQDAVLRFEIPRGDPSLHLRLDPADRPGPLTIRSACLQCHPGKATLLRMDATTGWAEIGATENAAVFPESGLFHLLSLNDDPQIRLKPQEPAGDFEHLILEITLRYRRDLTEFPEFWRGDA